MTPMRIAGLVLVVWLSIALYLIGLVKLAELIPV